MTRPPRSSPLTATLCPYPPLFPSRPVDASRRAEADAALARVATLLDVTGAEGFRPWLYLARAHWSDSAAAAARDVAIARDEFAAMGAFAHAARLADTAMSA